jgi:Flp pilus assembly protein TadG
MSTQSSAFAVNCARLARRLPLLGRFVRHQKGATAVEFGLVFAPFLVLMFAIIETAIVFFASQILETAVADSSRLILTGQAQNKAKTDALWKADPYKEFKTDVCDRLKVMFDCSKGLHVDVRSYSAFSGGDMSMPLKDGKLDPSFSPQYNPGNADQIVVVRVMYEWPISLSYLGANLTFDLSNMTGGKRMLMATTAFRNEPF